jgi:hypothetical protein
MKTQILLTLVLSVATLSSHAVTIAKWTVETSPPANLNNSTTISGIAADKGGGFASGFHTSAATDWSTPVGNGSAESLSANNWSVGDYYQFHVGTVGYQDIVVNWDQTRSSTGPASFDFTYSLDGVNFTVALDDYIVPAASWSSTTPDGTGDTSFLMDLSGISGVNNAADVYFRLSADSEPDGGGGTARVDNFTVSATEILVHDKPKSVPDASPGWAGLGALVLLLLVPWRRGVAVEG